MELVREENGKKIFLDGDRSYTMIDMGSYVGHMYRDWYEAAPEVWILMQSDDGNSKIESLVDSNGEYIRFVADEGNVRRIIQMDGGKVYNDSIVIGADELDGSMGPSYVAKDGDIYSGESEKIEEYLLHQPEFLWDGNPYEGDFPENELFTDFMEKNIELNKMLNQDKKNKTI